MKKFILVALVTLATVCFAGRSHGQDTLAPLYLYTSGDGNITPLESGQLLDVGQSYDMTAVPDAGYVFSSWQPVNVFVKRDAQSCNQIENQYSPVGSTPHFSEAGHPVRHFQPLQQFSRPVNR